MQAQIDGQVVRVGKADFAMPDGSIQKVEDTAVYVSADDQYLGCVTFTDELRPEAATTMSELHKLGIKNLMMTPVIANQLLKKLRRQWVLIKSMLNVYPGKKLKSSNKCQRSKNQLPWSVTGKRCAVTGDC